MKRLLFPLFLFGLETRALAHEDYLSLFDYPAQLTLMVLLYALPGVVLALVLVKSLPRLHIAFRLILASVLPFIFWTALLFLVDASDHASFLEGLWNLVLAIFVFELWAVVVPGIVLICAAGLLEQRKRIGKGEADRFAETK